MQTRKMKRSISLLLALVFALSLMPLAVAAESRTGKLLLGTDDETGVEYYADFTKVDGVVSFDNIQSNVDNFKDYVMDVFKIMFSVEFYDGNDLYDEEEVVVPHDKISAPVEPERIGYQFAGWSPRNAGDTEYLWDFAYDTVNYDDVAYTGKPYVLELYAVWVPAGTYVDVAFAAGGIGDYNETADCPLLGCSKLRGPAVEGLPEEAVRTRGGYAIAKEDRPDNPVKEGYRFLGWTETDTANRSVDMDRLVFVNFNTWGAKDCTLYGAWQKETYKVTANNAESSIAGAADIVRVTAIDSYRESGYNVSASTAYYGAFANRSAMDGTVNTGANYRYYDWVTFTAYPKTTLSNAGAGGDWAVSGWYLNGQAVSAGGNFILGSNTLTYKVQATPNRETHFTVKFERVTYNVTFELFGGSFNATSKSYETLSYSAAADDWSVGNIPDLPTAANLVAPANSTLTFGGWLRITDASAGVGEVVADGTTFLDNKRADIFLAAIWTDSTSATIAMLKGDEFDAGHTPVVGSTKVATVIDAGNPTSAATAATAPVNLFVTGSNSAIDGGDYSATWWPNLTRAGYLPANGTGAMTGATGALGNNTWSAIKVKGSTPTAAASNQALTKDNTGEEVDTMTNVGLAKTNVDTVILYPKWQAAEVECSVEYLTTVDGSGIVGSVTQTNLPVLTTIAADTPLASVLTALSGNDPAATGALEVIRSGYILEGFKTHTGIVITHWPTVPTNLIAIWTPVKVEVTLDADDSSNIITGTESRTKEFILDFDHVSDAYVDNRIDYNSLYNFTQFTATHDNENKVFDRWVTDNDGNRANGFITDPVKVMSDLNADSTFYDETTSGSGTYDNRAVLDGETENGFSLVAANGGPKGARISLYAIYVDRMVNVYYKLDDGQWINPYPIVTKVRAGDSTVYAQIVAQDRSAIKNGFVIDGWYKEAELIHEFVNGDTLVEDTTLYAKWRGNRNTLNELNHYNVEFKAGEEDPHALSCTYDLGYPKNQAIAVNSNRKITNPGELSLPGWHFQGWYEEVECITPFNFDAAIPQTARISDDIVVYAKWARILPIDLTEVGGDITRLDLKMGTIIGPPGTSTDLGAFITRPGILGGVFDQLTITYGANKTTTRIGGNSNPTYVQAEQQIYKIVENVAASAWAMFPYIDDSAWVHNDNALTGTVTESIGAGLQLGYDKVDIKLDSADMRINVPVLAAKADFDYYGLYDAAGLPLKYGTYGGYGILSLNIAKLLDQELLRKANNIRIVETNKALQTVMGMTNDVKNTSVARSTWEGLRSQALTMLNFLVLDGEDIKIEFYADNDSKPAVTVNVTGNEIYRTYLIEAVAELGGKAAISPADGVVKDGGSVTLTATADEGYFFDGWYFKGLQASAEAVYTFTPVTDGEYVARFVEKGSFTVSFDAGTGEGEWGTLTKLGGEICTITTRCVNSFTRSKFVFAYFEDQFGGRYYKGNKFAVTQDLELTAKYFKVRTAKVSALNITNSAAGKIRVRYGRVDGAAGYQVRVSTSSSFASNKSGSKSYNGYVKNEIVTCNGKKLAVGTTYYVKVRAFKLDSQGQRVYGSYATAKSIKLAK